VDAGARGAFPNSRAWCTMKSCFRLRTPESAAPIGVLQRQADRVQRRASGISIHTLSSCRARTAGTRADVAAAHPRDRCCGPARTPARAASRHASHSFTSGAFASIALNCLQRQPLALRLHFGRRRSARRVSSPASPAPCPLVHTATMRERSACAVRSRPALRSPSTMSAQCRTVRPWQGSVPSFSSDLLVQRAPALRGVLVRGRHFVQQLRHRVPGAVRRSRSVGAARARSRSLRRGLVLGLGERDAADRHVLPVTGLRQVKYPGRGSRRPLGQSRRRRSRGRIMRLSGGLQGCGGGSDPTTRAACGST
jgi:hypothetical protein